MTGFRIFRVLAFACLALLVVAGSAMTQAAAGPRGVTTSQADSGDTGKKHTGPRIIGPDKPDVSEPAEDEPQTAAPEEPLTPDTPSENADEDTEEEAPGDVPPAQAGDPPVKAAEILRDPSALPFAARRMHELLIEAAKSGDIEKLRPFIGSGEDVTMLSFGGIEGDPIDFLKSTSGDPEGHEILAILLEVLEAGFVHVEAGTPNEMYVWPYFYAVPLDRLTPRQRVELFTLLTYGDYQEMLAFGAYFFYRTGITPQGRWRFFVAGD